MEEMKEIAKKTAKRLMTYQAKDNVLNDKLISYLASRGWPVKRRWSTADWHSTTIELPHELFESLKVEVKRESYDVEIGGIPLPTDIIGPTSCEIRFTLIFKERRLFLKKKKKFTFGINLDEYIDDELKVIDEDKLNATFEKYLKTIGVLV